MMCLKAISRRRRVGQAILTSARRYTDRRSESAVDMLGLQGSSICWQFVNEVILRMSKLFFQQENGRGQRGPKR